MKIKSIVAVSVLIMIIGVGVISQASPVFAESSESTTKDANVISLWDVKIENGKAILWAEVKNTGTESLDSNCKVHFWVLGPDEWINDYVGSRRCTVNDAGEDTGPVSPGESRWYKYEWTIHNNAKQGTHKYWAIVKEGDDEISEWSSGKDFTVSTTSTSKSASVTELWDVTIKNGKAILWAKVKNTGTEPLDSNCKVLFWVRGPDNWIDGTVGSRPCTVNDAGEDTGPVSPGESRWYKYEWTIPNNAKSGTHRYWVLVKEGDDAISEWSSGRDFTVSSASSIDAEIYKLYELPSGRYEKGDYVQVHYRVKNTGEENHRFYFGYSVKDELNGKWWDAPYKSETIKSDSSCRVRLKWKVPNDAPRGRYDVHLAVWERESGGYLYDELDRKTYDKQFSVADREWIGQADVWFCELADSGVARVIITDGNTQHLYENACWYANQIIDKAKEKGYTIVKSQTNMAYEIRAHVAGYWGGERDHSNPIDIELYTGNWCNFWNIPWEVIEVPCI